MHSALPGQFKFTLKDNHEFNYEVIVNIMYLDSKLVLHLVDSATAFNRGGFLKDILVKHVWDTL